MSKKRILVVEDNELNMKLVKSLLDMGGYETVGCPDAEEGIEYIRAQKPDLILMDIQLPGMDGVEASRRIKEDPDLNDIPIIALSSYAMQGDAEKALNVGCDGYITKPIDTRSFLKTIGSYLNQTATESTKILKRRNYLAPRILIVDDNPKNIKMMMGKLANRGYELLDAYSGEEALSKVQDTIPDLILLDIMMPGIDGYEVVKRLKRNQNTQHIPIILITALEGLEEKMKGLELGADEFLTKPVNSTELLARIKSMLKLRQFQEQLTIRTESEAHFGGELQKESHDDRVYSQRILLVEDNDKDIKLIKNFLINEQYELIVVRTGEEALSIVLNEKIDLVILDIILPGMGGFELCRRLREKDATKDIQIVIITCLNDLESKLKGIEEGADDFLVKPINHREIRARISALLRKKNYLDKLYSHYEMALNSAINDGLTGLYNHSYFKRFLDIEVKKSIRHGYIVTLFMMDLDDFKKYNDILGHLTGDIVLREVAKVIKENIREIDLAARYGGEEFAVVMPYADKVNALVVANRIREGINSHTFEYEASSRMKKITVSTGIASFPLDARTTNDLINKADSMLFKAKHEGKDRVCIYENQLSEKKSIIMI